MVGLKGERRLVVLGFSWNPITSPVLAHFHHPEAGHFIGLNGQGGQGHVRAGFLVVLEHQPIVHFVDVVAGKNQHMLGLLGADRVNVLINRVGRAHVPVGAHPLHRGQDLDEFPQLLGHNAGPAFTNVPVQGEGFVLGEDVDATQIRVDAVGEGDVDDAVVAAEGNRGFCPIASQGKKPFARSPR